MYYDTNLLVDPYYIYGTGDLSNKLKLHACDNSLLWMHMLHIWKLAFQSVSKKRDTTICILPVVQAPTNLCSMHFE